MKKIIKLTGFFILSYFQCFSQSGDGNNFNSYFIDPLHNSNIIPKTPNASVFTTYGAIPVNTSSGLPTISIPIFTIEEDGVQVPISLTYHASGIRVDEFSSTVGMKWSLNAGGGVFRTIQDVCDFGWDINEVEGWIRGVGNDLCHFEDWHNTHPNYDFDDVSKQEDFKEYFLDIHDKWPDLFNYNFLNFSGDFVFKPNGEIFESRKSNINIEYYDLFEDNIGNTYLFGTPERTEKKTYYFTEAENSLSIQRGDDIVGWMLDEIITRNGKTINFEYEEHVFEYNINRPSQQMVIANFCDPQDCIYELGCEKEGEYYNKTHVIKSTNSFYKTKNQLISKIYTSSIEVNFLYTDGSIGGVEIDGWDKRIDKIIIKDKITTKQKEFRFTYGYYNGDNRLKLTQVKEIGYDSLEKPPYIFTYDESNPLPTANSFSKDLMGYYNGKINASLIPKTAYNLDFYYNFDPLGVIKVYPLNNTAGDRYFHFNYLKAGSLTKIQYPTGGTTEFIYEPNAFGQNINEHLIKDNNEAHIANFGSYFHYSGTPSNGDPAYEIYNTLVRLEDVVGMLETESILDCPYCYEGEFPDYRVPLIRIYEWAGNNENEILTNYSQIASQKGDLVLKGSLYKGNSQDPIYLGFDADYTNADLDGVFLVQLKIHKEVQNPTGPPFPVPPPPNVSVNFYWHTKMRDNNDNYIYQEHYFGGLRIKEILDKDENGNIFHHKKYTYLDAEAFETFSSFDYFDVINNQIIISSDRIYGYGIWPSKGYVYTKVGVENIGDENIGKTVEYYIPKRSFGNITGGDIIKREIYDSSDNVISISEYNYQTHNSQDSNYKFKFEIPSLANHSIIHYIQCPLPIEPYYTVGYRYIIGHHHLTSMYNYFGGWKVLSEEKTTEFFKRGSTHYPVTTIKNYEYNDDLLVTEEVIDTRYTGNLDGNGEMVYTLDNTDGEIIEVEYTYPSDHSLTLPKALTISKEVENNSLKILGQYFVYDNNGNIHKTFHYNKGQGSNTYGSYIPSDYEEITSYEFLNGKPVQVQAKGGRPVSYIWGYNNTYPVAKLEGVTYSSINNTLKNNIINATDESNLITALNALRSHYYSSLSVMITTYTYSPLVGVTSITDPKGDKITYHYDGFGRLDHIKDADGNKLEEYDYHYRED